MPFVVLFGPINLLHLLLFMLSRNGPMGKTSDRLSLSLRKLCSFAVLFIKQHLVSPSLDVSLLNSRFAIRAMLAMPTPE
jgi:hypothetical protein